MPGIFGTRAPFLADINLIVQILNATLLLFSYRTIRRGDVPRHRRLMISAVVINLLAIGGLMIPSALISASQITYHPLAGLIALAAPLHAVGGGIIMLIAVYLIVSMYNYPRPNRLRVSYFKTVMRLVLAFWLLIIAGGFVLYTLKYIL